MPACLPVLTSSTAEFLPKQQLLRLIFRLFVGRQRQQWYETLDWEKECDRFRDPSLIYPDYYISQNFHGIQGGYLNAIAATTYDPVTTIASLPDETYVRRQLIAAIDGHPRHILDLGCGTGSSTILLKQAFPEADVTGIDLSPYMLAIAHHRAQAAHVTLNLQHSLAESTDFSSNCFDLVTASFLFHEMPPNIAQNVLREARRLLQPGGQVLILDGDQRKLRRMPWLIDLFREPYSKVYAAEHTETWLKTLDFDAVTTDRIGWIQQLNGAIKRHESMN